MFTIGVGNCVGSPWFLLLDTGGVGLFMSVGRNSCEFEWGGEGRL